MHSSLSDLLGAVPQRAVEHLVREDGRFTLLRPKFTSGRLQWFQKMLTRPHFKVKLDDVGTCLWAHMDGQRTGHDLVEILRLAFGERVEPADERTAQFLHQLAEGKFIRFP
ncbi:MAG: PqqD family protein [Firmicutes bacterium]|nr:PqqD family protein [Bacillota bacterium]